MAQDLSPTKDLVATAHFFLEWKSVLQVLILLIYSPLLLLEAFYIFFQANNCPFLNF